MPILNSKIFTAVLGIFLFWLATSSIGLHSQKKSVEEQLGGINSKIKSTKKDNSYLEKFLAYFESPAFLEKEARLRLNYKASDEEVVFVYKDLAAKKSSTSDNFKQELTTMPNYKKWLYYLLGY